MLTVLLGRCWADNELHKFSTLPWGTNSFWHFSCFSISCGSRGKWAFIGYDLERSLQNFSNTNNLLYHWLSGCRFPHRDHCLPDTSIAKHCRIYWNQRNSLIFPFLQKAASVATFISLITMNSSYIILLSLTWSQFLAISSPHKHKGLVTKRRAKASLILTWAYTIVFAILYGVEKTVLFKVDLYVHTTGSLLLLTIAYFCLYKAFKRHMRRLQSNNLSRVNRRQRQFTIVNLLLLMFVIVCTLPITVVSYLHIHHTESSTHSLKMKIAHLLSCNMLFLKFALDPLIYAWRLTQYRQALKPLVTCRRHRIKLTMWFLIRWIIKH